MLYVSDCDVLQVTRRAARRLVSGCCPRPSTAGSYHYHYHYHGHHYIIISSHHHIRRFRAVVKRLDGCSDKWLRNSLVIALGGFATRTRSAREGDNIWGEWFYPDPTQQLTLA